MPKAEAAGHVRFANEVELQQFVYGIERRRLGVAAARRRKLWVERVAGDRRPSKNQARAV